jgi:hypothetical protein
MIEIRPTVESTELVNAHANPPPSGARVLALTQGGTLVPTIWKSDSLQYFDAWCYYPKIPPDVKKIQQARLTQA